MIKKILLTTLLFTSFQIFAAPVDPNVVKQTITHLMEKNQIPGVAVQLYVNGTPSSYYFGYANLEKKTPITEHTIFEIGSITKIMTSLLLAEQVDAAKVQLNDSITKYRTELPDTFSNITFLNLATHTSGLSFDVDEDIKTLSSLENYLKNWKPVQQPNENWLYSNFGVGMLGYALQTITHKSFDQMYRDEILKPLRMTPIALSVPVRLKTDYAQGYDSENEPVNASPIGLFPAATGMKVTAYDMQRFLAASIGLPGTSEKILYPMRMTQTGYIKLGEGEYQGLGWQIHLIAEDDASDLLNVAEMDHGPTAIQKLNDKPAYNGEALIDKTGTTNGFRAYIAIIPNKKSGIVILANKHIANADLVKAGREILFEVAKVNVKENP